MEKEKKEEENIFRLSSPSKIDYHRKVVTIDFGCKYVEEKKSDRMSKFTFKYKKINK